jgi:hypothetical protein
MTASWSCTLAYPAHWVELHLATDAELPDLTGLVDAGGDEHDRLAELIEALATSDAAQGAVLSAHRYTATAGEGSVHGHLAVWILPREHPLVDDELTALAGDFRNAADGDLADPRFARCRLPAGEALRVQRLDAAHDDDTTPDGADDGVTCGPVVLSVSYLVPTSSPDHTLWLRFWTPNLLAADDLVAEFDTIAHALTVTRFC